MTSVSSRDLLKISRLILMIINDMNHDCLEDRDIADLSSLS